MIESCECDQSLEFISIFTNIIFFMIMIPYITKYLC
jgi:hypothetical protein